MPELQTSLVQLNTFFHSHSGSFMEPTASGTYANVPAFKPDVARVNISILNILLIELEKGYRTVKGIPVAIRRDGNEFVASFEAANIHATGDTWHNAASHLRTLILDVYDSLIMESPSALGPAPKRQLATLMTYVQPD